jgi:glycosyltransferase involved in cell wall biosynthesis
MTRVLALTKYGRAGPSSRVRTYQFLPQFERAGLQVTVLPLQGDDYIERLYSQGSRDPLAALKAYAGRAATLLNPPPHDVVWVEKELFPYLPALAEGLLSARLGPMVVDYDDAIFHNYDLHRRGAVRMLLGRKIDAVMRRAALVVAGNDYLKARALKAGARRVEVLPSVVDVPTYHHPREQRSTPVIGWMGTPSTAHNLGLIAAPLAAMQARHGAVVRVVARGQIPIEGVQVDCVDWAEDRQAQDLAGCDIGVMPLFGTPFDHGKCGYKIVQYMAAGLPVVASAVSANRDIVEHGVSGFLADTDAEWEQALETLIADPALRERMGKAGYERALARYSTEAVGERLTQLLKEVAR